MLIKEGSVSIPIHSGAKTAEVTAAINMGKQVTGFHVALTGFRAEYAGGKDEEVRILKVVVEPVAQAGPSSTVSVRCKLWLADKGNDNKFNGSVYFLVLANTLGGPLPIGQS